MAGGTTTRTIRKEVMTVYRIPFVEKARGVILIEADTPEDARRIVDEGEFDGNEDYLYFNNEYFFESETVEED
jgi:hypothetical protein